MTRTPGPWPLTPAPESKPPLSDLVERVREAIDAAENVEGSYQAYAAIKAVLLAQWDEVTGRERSEDGAPVSFRKYHIRAEHFIEAFARANGIDLSEKDEG